MNFFIILLSGLFSIFFIISAQAHMLFPQGLYAGTGLGWTMTKFSHEFVDRNTGNDFEVKARENSFKGTVFIGYRIPIRDLCYLGGEIGTGFPQVNYIDAFRRPRTQQSYSNQMSVRDIFYMDLTFTPDLFMLPRMMVYARVGLAYARLASTQSLSGVGTVSTSENHTGLRLGASIEYAISKHFTIGSDYIFTTYNRLYNNNLPGVRILSSIKPVQNFVDLRIVYWPFT